MPTSVSTAPYRATMPRPTEPVPEWMHSAVC